VIVQKPDIIWHGKKPLIKIAVYSI